MRWFKKRYIALLLLAAFLMWGLWPMLVPRWDQDKCSFGEVSNERYWKMREEVRKDVKKTSKALHDSFSVSDKDFIKQYPLDLDLIKRWNPSVTPEMLRFYPGGGDKKKIIWTRLLLKYVNQTQSNDKKIAFMHAIMKEMGGQFNALIKRKDFIEYRYLFPWGWFQNTFGAWITTLITRYEFVSLRFEFSHTHRDISFAYTYSILPSLLDTHIYAHSYKYRGCPHLPNSVKID